MSILKEKIISDLKGRTFRESLEVLIDYNSDEISDMTIEIIELKVKELLKRQREICAEQVFSLYIPAPVLVNLQNYVKNAPEPKDQK